MRRHQPAPTLCLPQPARSDLLPGLGRLRIALPVGFLLLVLLAGCSPSATPQLPQDPAAEAGAQATAIIQRAEATALAIQARSEATALVAQAQLEATSLVSQVTPHPAGGTTAGGTPASLEAAAGTPEMISAEAITNTVTAGEEPAAVRILRVSLAEETRYIYVQFLAPPELAQRWNQTSVYIEDIATGTRYSEVPFMPLIGPLFNRPARAGQSGFFMIINLPTPLDFGARVRVKLGNYIFEDLEIER